MTVRFRQSDAVRALKAATKAGLSPKSVRISTNGEIVVDLSSEDWEPSNSFDELLPRGRAK